jgi:hypothetical protein
MSESGIATVVASPRTHEGTVRQRARDKFYLAMTVALLLIALLGFARSLYLRAFFAAPALPTYLWVHGVLLSAWFVGILLQTSLVAAHRTDLHRRLGWGLAGLGVAIVAITTWVTLNLVPRFKASGGDVDDMRNIAIASPIVWSDFADLVFFTIFLTTALVLRHRPEVHKRLMLLSSISLIHPAMVRAVRAPASAMGLDYLTVSLAGVLLLVLAIVVYDLVSRKRLQLVTVLGGSSYALLKVVSIFVIASSDFGRSFVRGLA